MLPEVQKSPMGHSVLVIRGQHRPEGFLELGALHLA